MLLLERGYRDTLRFLVPLHRPFRNITNSTSVSNQHALLNRLFHNFAVCPLLPRFSLSLLPSLPSSLLIVTCRMVVAPFWTCPYDVVPNHLTKRSKNRIDWSHHAHTQPSKPAWTGRTTDFHSLAPREGRIFDSRIPSHFYLVMGTSTMVWYSLCIKKKYTLGKISLTRDVVNESSE